MTSVSNSNSGWEVAGSKRIMARKAMGGGAKMNGKALVKELAASIPKLNTMRNCIHMLYLFHLNHSTRS